MTDEHEEPDGETPERPPPERLRPKRGAFPTPKSELEKAEPYVPDTDDGTGADPGQPADDDSERKG